MNEEKNFKRWLKRKMSFTFSLLIVFLMTGMLSYTADPEVESLKSEISALKAKIEKLEGERNYYGFSSKSKLNLKGEQAKGEDVLVIGPGNEMPTDVKGEIQANRNVTLLGTNNNIKYVKYDKYDGSASMSGDIYSTTIIGNENKLTEPVATIVGSDNKVASRETVVVGNNITTTPDARSAVSIGFYSGVEGYAPVALGDYAKAKAGYAIAVGKSAEATAGRSIGIGALSKADVSGGVALGYKSLADVEAGKYAYAPDSNKKLETAENVAEYLGKLNEYKDLKAKIDAASDIKALKDESDKALGAYMDLGKQIDLERAKIVDAKTEKDRQDILDKISELSKEHQAKRKEYNEKSAAYEKHPKKEQYEKDQKALSELLSVMRSSSGAVSVGNSKEGIKRQITNVAGGTEDSDAVNVAQLKKLKSYVDSKSVNYYGVSSESVTNLKGEQAKGRDVLVIGPGNTMPTDIDGNVVSSYDTTVIGSNNNIEYIGKKDGKYALGNYTIGNTVVGLKNKSLGWTNTVLGESNKAYGSDATVLGSNNQASGQRAIAIGDSAKALGTDAIAQGFAAKAGDSSVSIGGYSKAEPVYSVSIGNDAVATKAMGVALGASSLADRGSKIYAYTPSFEKELKTEEDIAEYLGVKDKYNELKAKLEAENSVKEKYNEYITAVNERSLVDKKISEEKTKIFAAKTKEEKQKVLDNLDALQKEYDEKRKIELEKQDAYYKDPQYEAYKKDSAEMSNLLSTMRSSSSAVSVGSTKEGIKRQIINVAGGTEDSDAVNVAQLKSVVKYVKDVENHFPVNYVDKDGKKVVKAFDGKYYLEENLENGLPKEGATAIDPKDLHHALINAEGKPSDSVLSNVADGKISKDSKEAVNGSQLYVTNQKIDKLNSDLYDPAAEGQEPKLKGLKFVGNKKTEEYKKTLGEEVSILGDAGNAAKSADFSTKNVLTENKADGVYVMISDKPEFKSVTLNDGKKPAVLTSDDKGNLLINGNPIATSTDVAASKIKYFSVKSKEKENENNDGAQGDNSIAIGPKAKALKANSVSLGQGATSEQSYSISVGPEAKTNGIGAIAIGQRNTSKGNFALSMGLDSVANGTNSMAIGMDSKAGENVVAIGANTNAEKATFAQAIGTSAVLTELKDGENNIVEGKKITINKQNSANGSGTSVEKLDITEKDDEVLRKEHGNLYLSMAVGTKASAHDLGATAIGAFSTATHKHSIALGNSSQALNEYAIAIGDNAVSTASNSIALGRNSEVTKTDVIDGEAVFSKEKVSKENGVLSLGTDKVKRRVINVAGGINDTDAVNVKQLKEAINQGTKGLGDLYEDKKNDDGKVVDEKGNPLVKDADGNYYPEKDGKADKTNGPVEPAKVLKGIKYVGNVNTGEYKKTLGEEVKILGNTNVEEAKKADYSVTNVLTENTKDGLLIKMNDKPEFKEVTVKDGENGKAVYGKDGISITGPKGENGADGKTTTIKVDKEGNVVVGKDGKDGKVITEPDLKDAIDKVGKVSKEEVKDGVNTTVSKETAEDGHDIYKVNVKGDLKEITSISNGDTKVSLDKDGVNVNGSKITNVKAGEADTDAVNVKQLKDMVASSTTGNNDLYEGDKDNRKLKGLSFVGNVNTGEYKKTLGEEVKILGNTSNTVKAADFSVTNVLTENTKDGLLIKMNDKPLFKEVVVKDGENGPATAIKPGNVTVSNGKDGKDGKSSSFNPEGFEVKDGKDGENGKAFYGKDGISITGAKGEDGKDGKTTTIKVDKDGNVVIGKDGKDGNKVVTKDELDKITGGLSGDVNDRIKLIDNKADLALSGISTAVAMANLPQVSANGDHRRQISAGVGVYGGEGALAVGFSGLSKKEKLIYKVSGSVNTKGNLAFGVGLGYNFDRKDNFETRESDALKQRLEKLEKENQEMKALLNQILQNKK